MNEFDWIDWIQKKAGRPPQGWLGIGDDAAIFSGTKTNDWVISTDTIVEGVDFDQSVTPAQAGRKALAVNLSDMAAMAAKPSAFLMTLGVPRTWNQKKLRVFIQGIFALAKKFKLVCIGGDMSSSNQFFCSITILGKVSKNGAVLRSGAKPGDLILVTGNLGGSIKQKHYAFAPRVQEAEWLSQNFRPSALIDISDGLTQDLNHILKSSKVAARLDLETVPLSKEAKNIQAALSDGEDFELLMTMKSERYAKLKNVWKKKFPKTPLTAIGKVIPGKTGIDYFKDGSMLKQFKASSGFKHF